MQNTDLRDAPLISTTELGRMGRIGISNASSSPALLTKLPLRVAKRGAQANPLRTQLAISHQKGRLGRLAGRRADALSMTTRRRRGAQPPRTSSRKRDTVRSVSVRRSSAR